MNVTDFVPNTGWLVQSGPNVNVPASDSSTGGAFIPTPLPNGVLKTTNIGTVPMSGALVTNKRAVPPPFGGFAFPYLQMDTQVYVSSADFPMLARLEMDIKVCDPGMTAGQKNGVIYNFGGQWNQSTGLWEIDPAWTKTAFTPKITPDRWMPVCFKYFRNIATQQYSVVSIEWDGVLYTVPSTLQNNPCPLDSWAQVAAIQLQTEILTPGGLSILYNYDAKSTCKLTWSSDPQ